MGCHCHCRSNFDLPPSNAQAPTVSSMRWRSPVAVSSSPSLLAKPLCDSSRQPLGSIPQHQVPIRKLPSQLYAFSTAGPQPQALTSGNSSNLSSMIVMDCTMMALITKNALLGVHLSQHQTQEPLFRGGTGSFCRHTYSDIAGPLRLRVVFINSGMVLPLPDVHCHAIEA